jgi:hypothetical protein
VSRIFSEILEDIAFTFRVDEYAKQEASRWLPPKRQFTYKEQSGVTFQNKNSP